MSEAQNKQTKQQTKQQTKRKTQKHESPQTQVNGMDADNAKALDIMNKEGMDAAVKHMFNPTGQRQLSYAEMRMRFG